MDAEDVRAAWSRAAERAVAGAGRPERTMAPILRGDIPAFMEAPLAVQTGGSCPGPTWSSSVCHTRASSCSIR